MAIPTPRTVNVFGSDLETQPLAVFDTPITVDEIRKTLGVAKGGLKRKNGPEIFTQNLNAGGDFTFFGGPKFIISVTFMGTTAMLNVKSPKSKVRALIAEISAHFACTSAYTLLFALADAPSQRSSPVIPTKPESLSSAAVASS